MFSDRYGLPLSTFFEAAARAFDDAVERLLLGREGVLDALRLALRYDPEFALALAVLAVELQRAGDASAARDAIDRAVALSPDLTPREWSLIGALDELFAADAPEGAVRALAALTRHLETYPRDIFAVHQAAALATAGDDAWSLTLLFERLAPHYGDDEAFRALRQAPV